MKVCAAICIALSGLHPHGLPCCQTQHRRVSRHGGLPGAIQDGVHCIRTIYYQPERSVQTLPVFNLKGDDIGRCNWNSKDASVYVVGATIVVENLVEFERSVGVGVYPMVKIGCEANGLNLTAICKDEK